MPRQYANEIEDIGFYRPAGLSDLVLFDRQLGVVAALSVNDERQCITHDIDDYLFDKQPDDLLAYLDGRPGTVPRLGQILAERHQPRAIRGGKRWNMLRLFEDLELGLQVAQLNQLLVPAPLQLTGNQPVIGINGIVLPPCPGDFLLSVLDCVLAVLALVALMYALGFHRG